MPSFLPYLICFFTSAFLLWFGQKIKYGQSETFRWFIYAIALLIPIALAGVRDLSVGADIGTYGYPVFYDARLSPNIDAMPPIWDNWISEGFWALNFYASRISSNYNVFLFLLTLIEILCVFLALYFWRDKIPIWLGMFSFYAFFYNESLNTMRQCLALSIAFLGVKYIIKRKFLLFAVFVVLGSFFHKSVLIVFIYYPLYWYSLRFSSNKAKIVLISIILAIIYSIYSIATYVLPEIEALFEYATKATSYILNEGESRTMYKIIIFFGLLPILYIHKKKYVLCKFSEIGHFLILLAFLPVLSQLLLLSGAQVVRFTYLATWWTFLLVPIIFSCYYTSSKVRKIFVNIITLSYCLTYWFFNFITNNIAATDVFESQILRSIF